MRWYCRYPISYRDLEAMMTERGVAVDHSTIYRWVQRFAPEMEKRLRWQWRRPQSRSWRVDETYIKVRGKWAYLYRAVDKLGNTIDFYLSATRNTKAAKRFLGKALRGMKDWEQPEVLNTDKAPAYAAAIAELKAEGKCPKDTRHRQVKYLNNVVEADHGKLKLLIRPVRGFKTMKTAYATIKGFEVMRALRKGPSRDVRPPGRHCRRGPDRRAPGAGPMLRGISECQRVALVIGNAEYAHAPELANPLNDANDIGTALDRLGFEVTTLENADYDAMRRGLRAFTRASAASEIALVFYAGHGIEVDKRNFLIPVDARLLSDREVEFETVALDLVSRAVEGASGLGLVVLDACRDNPFAAAMKRSGASRSIGRGLAQIEPAGETLVAYAAKGGSVLQLGLMLGGRPAQALAERLLLPVRKDTFLRSVRAASRHAPEQLRVIGIDDWAWRVQRHRT